MAIRKSFGLAKIINYFLKIMCKNCKSCATSITLKVLVIIGGINWGLVGVGMLLGSNLNLVNLLLGGAPTVEALVYVLVGLAALGHAMGCRCKTCKTCGVDASKAEMPQNNPPMPGAGMQ